MSTPPALAPEHIDAMLSRVAQVCMAKVEEASARMTAAEDMADFERGGRTLNMACRNVRQTIAMKQRFDREQAALAAERRRDAEAERKDAERARDAAVGRHRGRVRNHFGRVLWDEYEEDDAQEIYNDLDDRLAELADDGAFLETPVETLILRLAEEFGVGVGGPAEEDALEGPATPDSTAEDAETDAETAEAFSAVSATSAEPLRPLRLNPAAEPIAAAPPDPEPPPQADSPLRPPDPPLEPYIPPWDRIPPGRRRPGSSSWMA